MISSASTSTPSRIPRYACPAAQLHKRGKSPTGGRSTGTRTTWRTTAGATHAGGWVGGRGRSSSRGSSGGGAGIGPVGGPAGGNGPLLLSFSSFGHLGNSLP